MTAVKVIIPSRFPVPYGSYVYLARATRNLRRLPALFINIGLDDLRRQPGRQLAMFPTFEEHRDDDVGIAPGRESHEPAILIQSFVVLVQSPNREGHDLRRPRLPSDINSRDVRRGRRAFRQQYPRHRIRDEVEAVRIDWDIGH